VLRGKADVLLAETDTCPQNRYSTSAQSLHAHFTGSILEGMRGAKHWVTNLHTFDPDSGEAYRRKLSEYRGFYDALSALVPQVEWLGCRVPVSSVPGYDFATSPALHQLNGWPACVLERLGLPMYFSEENGGAAFMDGPADAHMSDDEVRELFKGTVFLSAETAMRLNERGFSDCTGVDVRPWMGRNASGELIYAADRTCSAQMQVCELVPLNESVRSESLVFHIPDGKTREPLFPGVTAFDNPLGGRTVVFSGTPKARFIITEAFSFLNSARKAQLVKLLREAGELPMYYPGDVEIYLRAGRCPDGSTLCAVFNLGFDWLDEIPLNIDGAVTKVERLLPDGTRGACGFRQEGESVIVECPARTLDPVILFIERA